MRSAESTTSRVIRTSQPAGLGRAGGGGANGEGRQYASTTRAVASDDGRDAMTAACAGLGVPGLRSTCTARPAAAACAALRGAAGGRRAANEGAWAVRRRRLAARWRGRRRRRREDYAAAIQSAPRPGQLLQGPKIAASWDGSLARAMLTHQQAIAEESVAGLLLEDLESAEPRAEPRADSHCR